MIPDPRKIVAGYPHELFRIVDKALQRNRDNRYPDASMLARDLDAFVRSTTTDDLTQLIAPILENLFPGDRARQMGWLRGASASTKGAAGPTIPPPAPLPSTNDVDDES
jgi:hypothetical protein